MLTYPRSKNELNKAWCNIVVEKLILEALSKYKKDDTFTVNSIFEDESLYTKNTAGQIGICFAKIVRSKCSGKIKRCTKGTYPTVYQIL